MSASNRPISGRRGGMGHSHEPAANQQERAEAYLHIGNVSSTHSRRGLAEGVGLGFQSQRTLTKRGGVRRCKNRLLPPMFWREEPRVRTQFDFGTVTCTTASVVLLELSLPV